MEIHVFLFTTELITNLDLNQYIYIFYQEKEWNQKKRKRQEAMERGESKFLVLIPEYVSSDDATKYLVLSDSD